MTPTVRSVLAVLSGLITGFVVIGAVDMLNSLIYPLPEGVNPADIKAMRNVIAGLPPAAFAGVLLGWALGTLAGSWVAARLGRRARAAHGVIVGVLLMAATVANMLMLPHPAWVWVVALVMFVPLAWLGARLAAPGAARA